MATAPQQPRQEGRSVMLLCGRVTTVKVPVGMRAQYHCIFIRLDARLKARSGTQVAQSSRRRKPALPPCRSSIPHKEKVQSALGKKGSAEIARTDKEKPPSSLKTVPLKLIK